MNAKSWAGVLVLCAALYGSFVGWRAYRAAHETDPASEARQASETRQAETRQQFYAKQPPVGEFQLTGTNGKPFDSSSLKGHVWVGSFFFANCPGPCFKLNKTLEQVQSAIAGSDVRLVSITCDPDNDTPETLAKYALHFHAEPDRWIFLTGPMPEIERVGSEVFSTEVGKAMHSERAVVFDRQGRPRDSFLLTDETQVKRMEKLIEKLVHEPSQGAS